MKFSLKFAALIFILSNLAACSSTHKKLRKVKLGTFKRQALSKFGEPIEKYRTKGQDHWIYETQQKSKHRGEPIVFQHILVFDDGVMVDKKIKRTFTSKELEDFYETK